MLNFHCFLFKFPSVDMYAPSPRSALFGLSRFVLIFGSEVLKDSLLQRSTYIMLVYSKYRAVRNRT